MRSKKIVIELYEIKTLQQGIQETSDQIKSVAIELGISSSQLSKWYSEMKIYKKQSFSGRSVNCLTDEQREIKEFKKHLKTKS